MRIHEPYIHPSHTATFHLRADRVLIIYTPTSRPNMQSSDWVNLRVVPARDDTAAQPLP